MSVRLCSGLHDALGELEVFDRQGGPLAVQRDAVRLLQQIGNVRFGSRLQCKVRVESMHHVIIIIARELFDQTSERRVWDQ